MRNTGTTRHPIYHFNPGEATRVDRCHLCDNWGPVDECTFSGATHSFRDRMRGTVVLPAPASPYACAHICHACHAAIVPGKLPNFRLAHHYLNPRLAAYERRVLRAPSHHAPYIVVQIKTPEFESHALQPEPDELNRTLLKTRKTREKNSD